MIVDIRYGVERGLLELRKAVQQPKKNSPIQDARNCDMEFFW
jgi:hypothetical protein